MCVRVRLVLVFMITSVLLFTALPRQAKSETGTTRLYPPNNTGNIYSTSKLPDCQRSFDPYKVPRSFLKKCGVKTIPLIAVKPLPGGGKDYAYKDGTHMPVPPKGFNTCKATKKQRAEYNLPPRSWDYTPGKRNGRCHPAHITSAGPFIVATNMTSGGMPATGIGGGLMGSSTGATSTSSSQTGSTFSMISHPASIPDTGGPSLLLYAAALFVASGVVTLVVLRRSVR